MSRPLTLKDIHLRVNVPKGTYKEKDVNCDSDFMLETIDEIGANIREYYSFVPNQTPIHLFMDNAGGHGKVSCKEKYVQHLKQRYNVIVVWQVPYSPETNMLDLGVWVALQSFTEHLHKKRVMHADVLSQSVYEAYQKIDASIFSKVYQRWRLVLKLIKAGRGTNNLVEAHRGLKINLAQLPEVPDLDSDDEETVRGLVQKAEDEDIEERSLEGQANRDQANSV